MDVDGCGRVRVVDEAGRGSLGGVEAVDEVGSGCGRPGGVGVEEAARPWTAVGVGGRGPWTRRAVGVDRWAGSRPWTMSAVGVGGRAGSGSRRPLGRGRGRLWVWAGAGRGRGRPWKRMKVLVGQNVFS